MAPGVHAVSAKAMAGTAPALFDDQTFAFTTGMPAGAGTVGDGAFLFEDPYAGVAPEFWQSAQLHGYLAPESFVEIRPGEVPAVQSPEQTLSVDSPGSSEVYESTAGTPSSSVRSDDKVSSDEAMSGNNSDDSLEEAASAQTSVPLFSSFRLAGKGAIASRKREASESPPSDKFQRHNQSEKKRRDNMNEYIVALHQMVPALHTIHKPSKGMILGKTIEYLKRMQQKSAKLESQVSELVEELKKQRHFTDTLAGLLHEHGIAAPSLHEVQPYMAAAGADGAYAHMPLATPSGTPQPHRSVGYYVQDAGRVTVLFGALMFFLFAPWMPPTFADAGAAAVDGLSSSSSRSLLSEPMAAFEMTGWGAFFGWLFVRWVIMSGFLCVAMFTDTLYCAQDVIKKLPTAARLNTLAEECMANGNYRQASDYTDEALALLNRPVPSSSFDLLFGNLYQGARQIAHRCVVGLLFDRFLFFSRGQMAYVHELQRCYLNKTAQTHCLPFYNKWADLYTILCSVNYTEVIEGDMGDGLVRGYSAICYHVLVHSRVFEIFASIYMSLAFRAVNRMGLQGSHFGQFYIIVAYRHLMKGHFQQLFDNIQKGMEMHRMFGQGHHYRECLNVRAWIEHILGLPQTSSESFRLLCDLADLDNDNYGKLWATLGVAANALHCGMYDTAADYLSRADALDDGTNTHQMVFALGFRAHLHLRELFEDGALEMSDRVLAKLKEPTVVSAPHNVLPLMKLLEVHLTLLERYKNDESAHGRSVSERCRTSLAEALAMYRQFVTLFPLMQSSLLIMEARAAVVLRDETERAIEMLERAVRDARKFNLKMMEGTALFELGRLLPVDDAKRMRHLEAAADIFKGVEARYEELLAHAEMQTKFASRLFKVQADM